MWFFSILVVLAMGGVAAVAMGRGEPMASEHPDRPDVLVPATGPLAASDLRAVRFPLVFRGYRMAEVDALLDRLAEQVDDRSDPHGGDDHGDDEPSAPTTLDAVDEDRTR